MIRWILVLLTSFELKCFRTFNYRNVASLMCECTPNCLEVATLYGTGLYNMQGREISQLLPLVSNITT